uniref:IQ motif containing GTPase activating protein 2 n=1 Tax=Hucho hucho TaxID=62062 RepID=A0A4W5MGS5_9TELE
PWQQLMGIHTNRLLHCYVVCLLCLLAAALCKVSGDVNERPMTNASSGCYFQIFYPETTDVYNRKNMPKVVYCIHALSLYLYKQGIAPQIQDLLGKVAFTEEEISNMRSELEKYGIQMPTFSKIGGILANELSVDEATLHAAVFAINEAVDKGEAAVTIGTLRNPNAMLRNTGEELAQDYQDTLSRAKASKELQASGRVRNLQTLPDVALSTQEATRRRLSFDQRPMELEAITAINSAIRHGVAAETIEELMNSEAQLPIVYQTAANLYQTELFSLQIQGAKAGLGHEELSVAVEMLSAVAVLHSQIIIVLSSVSLWLFTCCLVQFNSPLTVNVTTCAVCLIPPLGIIAISEINEALSSGYPNQTLSALLLPTAKLQGVNPATAKHYHDVLQNTNSGDESAVLWLNQIQEGIHTANQDEEEALTLAGAVADINREVATGDSQTTLQALQSPLPGLRGVLSECADTYQTQLGQRQDLNSVWVKHKIKGGYDYYYNLESREGTWEEPEDFTHNSTQLSREEIQSVVGGVTAEYNREQLWLTNEALVTQLQARVRGYLVRRAHTQRLDFLRQQEPHVCQFSGDSSQQKQLPIADIVVFLLVQLQSFVKMWRAKSKYSQRLQYFKDHVSNKAPTLQMRSYVMYSYYIILFISDISGAQDPPLSVVRKFVHLLEQSSLDLLEEQEVTWLREKVVTKIRSNQQMEKDLNLMDIKIGLLVKNRITLQDVVSHSKKLTVKKSKEELAAGDRQGIKALSKDKRKKLEAYQHLFYLLQTNPSYLAKLIFQMPQNKSTKFMDTVIFTLYNYASNQREEYLLLKLFKTALEEEIKSKVDQIQDIVTGNPTVIKMVVSFNRGARGHNTLRQLLAPVVKEIIEDKDLGINTNPVEVYKAWVNQLETNTGEASKLPYEVTPDQAMSHEEVRAKLESSSRALRTATDKVLNSIVSSLDNIPYGMRYIAKVLKNSLHEKFPDATEDELLKIVGNLLYYRYMNPAIVAPDGFDIIDMSAGGQLHSDQRRNLGSVAKMLQHAAANKLFEGENAHMTPMNNYISQTYQNFRVFFQAACDVPEPEEKFNVDEYSDMVTLCKPVIYISIDEIINTHSVSSDYLCIPNVLHYVENSGCDAHLRCNLGDLFSVSLSVSVRTKKLIMDVIKIQPGDTLPETLETPASGLQEREHAKVVELRAVQDAQAPEGLKSSQAVLEDRQLPLEQKKRKILRNLRTLEQAGLVTAGNKYQDLINDISKDIRYQRRYRQRRKAELVKLQQTLMSPTKRTPRKVEEKGSKKWKHQSLKYTAARLHEKGVILEIEGLQSNQLKNVMFDISPSEEVGDFEVKAKFMGVEMEKVQLHFQDLLQLQYDGVAVMKMFDKAKVNVNLLIFLLNKKFYGK